MYAYFQGKLVDKSIDCCIVDVNGIGYNIYISSSTANLLPDIGENVKLYTFTSVKENAIQLFGFLSNDDISMFRQLITVNGIGPKGALSILSVMSADQIRLAIISGDTKQLAKAPGVGLRSAERLVIDLKGKINPEDLLVNSTNRLESKQTSGNTSLNSVAKEACEALTALGYGASEALKAVNGLDITDDMDVEDIIKLALKELF